MCSARGPRFALVALVAPAALVAACGGESQRTTAEPRAETDTAPPDAVLWTTDDAGSTELRIVRRRRAGSELLGRADGRYLVSPDGLHAFLARWDGPVIATLGHPDVLLDPARDYWLGAWSPDSRRLALLADGMPLVIDEGGEHPVPVPADLGTALGHVAWSPDGLRVAFGIGASVVVALADGSDAEVFATGPNIPESDVQWSLAPVWSPGSQAISVISNQQELVVIAVDRGTAGRTASITLSPPDFGWSSDGAWFAVRSVEHNCYLVSPDFSTIELVAWDCAGLAWSPAGAELVAIDSRHEVTAWPYDAFVPPYWYASDLPVWSPDGTIIAYTPLDGDGGLLVDPHTGETRGSYAATDALHWDSSGTRLAFVSGHALISAAVDGQGERTLAEDVQAITWLPGGEALAAATGREAFTIGWDGAWRTVAYAFPPTTTDFGWVEL